METEMPTGFDSEHPEKMEGTPTANPDDHEGLDPNAGGQGVHLTSSRRASSQDSSNFDEEVQEEEEEDPDWSGDHEDPDDPEWTGREELPVAGSSTAVPKTSSKKQPHPQK